VHGGGWKRGDRNYMFDVYNNLGRSLANKGFVAVLPSYRLSTAIDGGVKHPDHARDVAHSLKWVQDTISQYGGNPDRVFLSGHSAGGHLVTLLALDLSYFTYVGIQHPKTFIKGVISISGVYDLVANNNFMARMMYIQDSFGTDTEILKSASPLTYVRKDGPPILLMNAEKDLGLDVDSEKLMLSLKALADNYDVRRKNYPGTNHGSIIGLTKFGRTHQPVIDDMVNTLDTWLTILEKKEREKKKKNKKNKKEKEEEEEEEQEEEEEEEEEEDHPSKEK